MARLITPSVLTDGLDGHEAVQAWRRLHPADVVPVRIEVLQHNRKSAVYRLDGIGPHRARIIAKRTRPVTGQIERVIYNGILRGVPVPTLAFHGYVSDDSGEAVWLFLEDAGGDPYSRLNDAHRALAGRWLAAIHLGTAELKDALPDRGLEHYLRLLRACRHGLTGLCQAILPADEMLLAASFISFCDRLESCWPQIDGACRVLPRTLVHGDFSVKNVRVRERGPGPALMVFDWQFAGCGVPAADLSQFIDRMVSPDLEAYRSAVAARYPGLQLGDVQRMAVCGNAFRLLDTVNWALSGLRVGEPKWVAKAGALLRAYLPAIPETLRRIETGLR
jgi:Phosphotransferase enzyme family